MNVTASAPGKVIVCGEHAVVYGRPAIAVPLSSVRATATVQAFQGGGIMCVAPDLGERWLLSERPDHPLAQLVQTTLQRWGYTDPPPMEITLRSDLPVASGMGSGAALGAALVKALGAYFERSLTPADVAALVYESERAFHGTPSGIDNTVVSYEQPIWFVRNPDGAPPLIELLDVRTPLHLVIGDTGVRAPTYVTVGAIRAAWQRDPGPYEAVFDQIGAIVRAVRTALARGEITLIGALLNRNQALLRELGVSSPELEHLIAAALNAGALGAKLSGGGGGGIMLALVDQVRMAAVQGALRDAGAARVLATTVAAGQAAWERERTNDLVR